MFAKSAAYFYPEEMFLFQTIADECICYAAYSIVGYAAAATGDLQEKKRQI